MYDISCPTLEIAPYHVVISVRARGRAVSFHSFSAMAANNIGTFEVGFMSAQIGAGNTMLLGGVVSVIVVITVWRVASSLRDYRYP